MHHFNRIPTAGFFVQGTAPCSSQFFRLWACMEIFLQQTYRLLGARSFLPCMYIWQDSQINHHPQPSMWWVWVITKSGQNNT